MSLDHSLVGLPGEPQLRSWDSKDALLYAVGVGAGLGDPLRELEFTTENCEGIEQKVLPTFAVLVAQTGPDAASVTSRGPCSCTLSRHSNCTSRCQCTDLSAPPRPSPVSTTRAPARSSVTENVVRWTPSTGRPAGDHQEQGGASCRGEGGFGGARGLTARSGEQPQAGPTWTGRVGNQGGAGTDLPAVRRPEPATRRTRVSPPRGGFDQPILHGLCTYGVTGRALLHLLCASDPSRFRSMSGRFTGPVLPGDSLTVRVWLEGTDTALFQTTRQDGTVVIDRGRLQVRMPEQDSGVFLTSTGPEMHRAQSDP